MQQTKRRVAGLVAAMVAAGAGVAVSATPAMAARSYSFSGPTAYGTVTFTDAHHATVSGHISGDSSGPGYFAQGHYFLGNGRYDCVDSSDHVSYIDDGRTHTFTDTLNCQNYHLQQIVVFYTRGGSVLSVSYISNPLG